MSAPSTVGFVNRVDAHGTERDAALALAHKIAAKSAHVVPETPRRLHRICGETHSDLGRLLNDQVGDAARGVESHTLG